MLARFETGTLYMEYLTLASKSDSNYNKIEADMLTPSFILIYIYIIV